MKTGRLPSDLPRQAYGFEFLFVCGPSCMYFVDSKSGSSFGSLQRCKPEQVVALGSTFCVSLVGAKTHGVNYHSRVNEEDGSLSIYP